MEIQNIFLKDSEKYLPWVINIRHELHKYPELDFNLPETIKIITTSLKELNIPFKTGIGKSGIIAELKGKNKNITIALRADMDALPIIEKNKCPYTSKFHGNMHACGHDAHMAVLLGVAKILSENKEYLPCNVKFLFQPAEETTGGALPMINDNCLKDVSAIFGLHMDPSLETGKIGIKYGAMNASSTRIKFKITGKSCHGAYPSKGVDAIVTAAQVISSIQSIISRNIDSRDSAVITFGQISGGEAENIIAQEVTCIGTMRTISNHTKEVLKKRLKDMVKMISNAYGAKGEILFKDSYNALINHDEYVNIIKENSENLLGKENTIIKALTDMGVEDFAYYLEKVPGAFFHLGTKNKEKGITAPLHSENFSIDEDSLLIGIKIQILNILSTYKKLK